MSEKVLVNKEMVFKNGVINIQAAAYNRLRSMYEIEMIFLLKVSNYLFDFFSKKADSSGIFEEFRMNSIGI